MKKPLSIPTVNIDNVFKATIYTMLLSATVHLLVSLYSAIRLNEPDLINMFYILGLHLIFPSLAEGHINNLLGILLVISIGVTVYFIQQRHDNNPSSRRRKLVQ